MGMGELAMKKSTNIFLACVAIASAALLAGCTKNPFSSHGGKLIRFATISNGSSSTKTAYGVDGTIDGKTYQALDWKDGDVITVASPQAVVQNGSGNSSNYVVTVTSTGLRSKGTVANQGGNGLAWLDEEPANGYDFYAIYPETSDAISVATSGVVKATLPEPQTNTATTKTVTVQDGDSEITYTLYEPDMSLAFMSAAVHEIASSDDPVSLEFYPAFTAFEFNVSSKDEDVEILEIQLVGDATDAGLSGSYSFDAGSLAAQSATEKTATLNTATTTGEGESATTTGVTVTTTEGASFTLFTAPVTNTKALKLRVTSKDDEGTKTGYVMLTYATAVEGGHAAGDPVIFQAGHKYRINMLKLEGSKWKFAISLDGKVLPWIYTEEHSTYSENVQAKAFSIEGAIETGNTYEAFDTAANSDFWSYSTYNSKTDAEKAAYLEAHTTYYDRYYQVRTLKMEGITKPHFRVSFTPMSPYAGYWNLSAEAASSFGVTGQGGPEGFRIVLWDGESEVDDNWSSGQIMNKEVILLIYPNPSRDLTKEYCLLIKGQFSPNKAGEPTYSADSELQDVHGDGRYSYWKFVIPATQ